jgi:alginate O-acetyltransferase complex protein AlgI
MVFNSLIYLIFLSITAAAYYFLPGKIRWIWLLLASLGYYLSFIPVFLLLLLIVIIANYFLAEWNLKNAGNGTNHPLIFIIFINLLILAFFKYFNILFPGNNIHLNSVNIFFRTDPTNKMILPLGLSYFMFTIIGYQIEINRQNIQPERHLGYFSLYLLFFPKIAQGPIEKPQSLIPRLRQFPSFNYDMVTEGFRLILWGYFKKLVVADRLALYVNVVYNNNQVQNGTSLIVATIFYGFQIYADFSGYTDIALGSAKLFGFDLTPNFKRPYFARSVKEFWERWHISFSVWLRDYIFVPLAYFLTKRMKKETYFKISAAKWIYLIAIMITFGICGIWHGVGWNYLVWGLLFGFYLSCSNWTKDFYKNLRKRLHIKKTSYVFLIYGIIQTFTLVSFAWIFFRADTITDAVMIIKKIFTSSGPVYYDIPSNLIFAFFGVFALFVIDMKREFYHENLSILYNRYSIVRIFGIVVLALIILLVGVFDGGQFIYFRF